MSIALLRASWHDGRGSPSDRPVLYVDDVQSGRSLV